MVVETAKALVRTLDTIVKTVEMIMACFMGSITISGITLVLY